MPSGKKGSQLVEAAAILLIAMVFVSAIFAVDKGIINLQTEISNGIFHRIEELWDSSPIQAKAKGASEGTGETARESQLQSLGRALGGLLSDLKDPEFGWMVAEEAGRTFLFLVPQSVLGFFREVEYWRAWWNIKNGGPFEPSDLLTDALIAVGDCSFGVQLAVLDDLLFGGVRAISTYIETRDVCLALGQTFPGQFYQLLSLAADQTVDKETRARALGIAIGVVAFIAAVRELGGPIQRAIGKAFTKAWPKVKAALGRIASKASGLARRFFDELADFAMAAKEKFGELRGEELAEKAAELAEELADVEDDPEAIAASLRMVREWTDGGDPEDLAVFLKETAERSEVLFARKQIRKNFYDTICKIAEEEGVERAARARDDIEWIILLSEEKAGKQWYTGFLEDVADEAKSDVGEAERTIEIVRRALERDDAAPGRIVKTQDRVRLDIPDGILELLFDEEGIEPGDLVLVEYDGPDASFRTIAKYGGDVKGFHALLDEDAGPYKGDYGMATVRKLTDDGFMAFWQERSQCGNIMVENVGGKWYVSMDGKVFEMTLEGLGDAGGYIFEEATADEYALRYYKDGTVAIGREEGGKTIFRKIVDAYYDDAREEIALRLQGREEAYYIYFGETVDQFRWGPPETHRVELLSQDDIAIVASADKDSNAIGKLGERLGSDKVVIIDEGEILGKQVRIPGSGEEADLLARVGDKRILYEFKATTEQSRVNTLREIGINELQRYMSRLANVDEGRVIVFYIESNGYAEWFEVTVPR